MSSKAVTKIGKYDVVEILGKGGMGVVYKAQDPRIGRLVAIKMMTGGFAENPDLLKRFYREAQSTGMLQHPNIVIVYDLGDQEGNPFLVMEFLEGEGLDKIISARRDVSMVQKLDYIIQACNGLNYAHQRGIVHRDIKPANLMVLQDGSVKIVDFGIARIGDTSLTRTGQVVGTITYMSPEQINAQVVDGRTDIFSCGVMLYELLTYSNPFDGKDTASTLLKIIHEPPPPLKNFLKVYPPELEEVVHRSLAKDREERYATAEDFAFDLTRIQESLKKQMVSEYVSKARESLEKSEYSKAKELLQQVLRVDTQHGAAKELMQEVQQRLQKQQRGEQIRQLRSHAEDAFSQKQYHDALSYVEQALTLDKANTELLNLRDMVQEAGEQKKRLEESLRRAENAQLTGELEAAEKAIEEALSLDPENAQVKALQVSVGRELSEKKRSKEVQGLLEEARRDISSRKFTAAFEVLTKAEKIDPTSPEVHALKNLASSGREQESRRKDLEKFSGEIQDALNNEDYAAACDLAEDGLKKFPSDPGLLKLKGLADKQRETQEKKKFVEQQVAEANQLIAQGKAVKALEILEKAAAKAPGERRLQSLLAVVRDTAEREQADERKNEYMHKAREAMSRKDYAAAVKVLESAQAEIEGSAEINNLLQFARDEATSQTRRKKIDAAAEEAQRLIADEEYERAVSVLEATLKQNPDEELKVVLTEARRHVEDFTRKVEAAVSRAQRLLDGRKLDEAVKFLESQPKSFARSTSFTSILEKARTEQDEVKGVSGALEKARAAMQKGDFASAAKIIRACRETYGDTPEVKQAAAEIDTKRTALARTAVDKAIRDARTLLLSRQYGAALQGLEGVQDLVPAAPADLQSQYESLKKDAAAGASRQRKEAELGKTMVAGSTDASQTIVAGGYASGIQTQEAAHGVAPAAPAPAARPVAPAPAHAPPARPRVAEYAPPPSKFPPKFMAMAAAAVLVLGLVGYVAYRQFAAPAATAFVEINAVPWGTVKNITSESGSNVALPSEVRTPLRVYLPPGKYKIVVAGPGGDEKSGEITVSEEIPGSYTPVFEAVDVDKILKSF